MSSSDIARPRAFIFDLDGVLTDTAHLHFVAWRELAASLGLSFDATFNEQLKGVSRAESLERILALGTQRHTPAEKAAMAERKNAAYVKLLERMTRTPLTLITGIFGMNVHFPGFDTSEAWWGIVGGMVAVLVGLLGFFRFKRWL